MSYGDALRVLRTFARGHERRFGLAMVFAALSAAFGAFEPLMIAAMFNAFAHGQTQATLVYGGILVALTKLSGQAIRWRERIVGRLAPEIGHRLREALAARGQMVLETGLGLETTAVAGVHGVTMLLGSVLPRLATNAAALLLSCVVAVVMDWRVGVVMFLALGPCTWISWRGSMRIQAAGEEYAEARRLMSREIPRFFTAAARETVAAVGARSLVLGRFKRLSERMEKAQKASFAADTFASTAKDMRVYLMAALIAIMAGTRGLQTEVSLLQQVSPENLAGFFAMAISQVEQMLALVFFAVTFVQQIPQVNDVVKGLREPIERQGGEQPDGLTQLRLRDVTAGYGGVPVLEWLSSEVPAGSVVGLVAMSGAGKTTLFRLLAGHGAVKMQAGSATLSDQPLADIALPHLRRRGVVYVPQGAWAFDGTVRENLLAGDASLDEIRHACRLAGVLDEIEGWDAGFDTRIGPEGAASGGQVQRIGLARALLCVMRERPAVVLLDEPTGALPPASADMVLEQILSYLSGLGITVIVATHQLPLHRLVRRAVVLKGGRIVQDGDPVWLMQQPGSVYATLLSRSSGCEEEQRMPRV